MYVSNINGYLLEADNVFIEKRMKSISNVSEICLGGQPIDDGNLVLTKEEKEELLSWIFTPMYCSCWGKI